jgi:hypothetical protein
MKRTLVIATACILTIIIVNLQASDNTVSPEYNCMAPLPTLEEIAQTNMQGMLAGGRWDASDDIAWWAVHYANKLLDELENPQGNKVVRDGR